MIEMLPRSAPVWLLRLETRLSPYGLSNSSLRCFPWRVDDAFLTSPEVVEEEAAFLLQQQVPELDLAVVSILLVRAKCSMVRVLMVSEELLLLIRC
jgi:hypothetical protein